MAGIYIHIPFCKQACHYCNFHFSTSLRSKGEMLAALQQELLLQHQFLKGRKIETVYWGGGTPSLLSREEIMQIWEIIERYFDLENVREVTLEANPDNLTKAYLKSLQHSPVNRLSIGIQSFHDNDLVYMNRAHTAGEAEYSVKTAQDAGLENISIDLIYGTPTMNDQLWLQNIQVALALQVPHISSYALTVEEKTALSNAIKKRQAMEPDQAQAATQFSMLIEALRIAGYEHYEISNFALPGQYALHNTNYWKNVPYLGIGPSAHSYNGHSRQWNIANNALYIKALLMDKKVPFEIEHLSFKDRFNEYLMTSLRTMWGTDLHYIESEFGLETLQQLLRQSIVYQERGWLMIDAKKITLTDAGKLFADRIASELFL